MAGERQENAEAEHFERMLTAPDRGTENRPFKAGPVAMHEIHRDEGECDEVREPEQVQIGLVDRVDGAVDRARNESVQQGQAPGERHHQRGLLLDAADRQHQISPVIAVSLRTLRRVSSEPSAVNMAIPALGPSLGMAAAGTWIWMSLFSNSAGAMPIAAAPLLTILSAAWALLRIT